MLDNLNAHQKLDKNHYGNALLSPVTSFGLTGFSLLRFKVLSSLYANQIIPQLEQQRDLKHTEPEKKTVIFKISTEIYFNSGETGLNISFDLMATYRLSLEKYSNASFRKYLRSLNSAA